MNEETEDVCALLQQCLDIRQVWASACSTSPHIQFCETSVGHNRFFGNGRTVLLCREKWLFKPAVQPENLAHLEEVAKPSLVRPYMSDLKMSCCSSNCAASYELRADGETCSVQQVDPSPFEWTPQERSDFQCEMVDGIIRVFRGDDREEEAFPVPGNSFDFFSDMHW